MLLLKTDLLFQIYTWIGIVMGVLLLVGVVSAIISVWRGEPLPRHRLFK